MSAGTPHFAAALYARWCDSTWTNAAWTAHDDAPPEAEPDGGPLDFSAGEATEICFDSQAHWLQSCLKRLLAPDLAVDGAPGNRTRLATREFQRRVREFVPGAAALAADGLAGPSTIAALEAATATWAPSHGASGAPVRVGAVGVTSLSGGPGRVRVDAEGRALDLTFETRERRDRDGHALVDPHNLAQLTAPLEVAALTELGLDPGEAAVLRAIGLGGPGSVDTTGPELVALGFGFAGRGGGIAALLAAIEEDPEAREVHARLLAPLGLGVTYGSYRRLDPASGAIVERDGLELVLVDGDSSVRGDEAWAALRGQPHRLGALVLAAADPQVVRVQAQLWRSAVRERLLRGVVDGDLEVGHMVRTEVGVAAAMLLARRGFMALRSWLIEQLDVLARRFPGLALRDPADWAAEPALEAALVEAARARLNEAERGRLAGLRGHAAASLPVRAGVVGSAKAPPPGGGHVERRVKVSVYGTLAADSRLLVPVPAASPGPKRLHAAAARALTAMSAAVRDDLGLELKIASAWRAHRWTSRAQYEAVLVQRFGSIAEGKRWLGFDSPHETGLAIDIGVGGLWPSRSTADAQRRQPLHQWLVARAWEFGWYPYKVEPWHWECPLSLQAFKTGVVGPGDLTPPEGALTFCGDEDDEQALEDTDLGEQPLR